MVTREEEIEQIFDRVLKLSEKPPNPGLAYRNLDMIHDLLLNLRQKLKDLRG